MICIFLKRICITLGLPYDLCSLFEKIYIIWPRHVIYLLLGKDFYHWPRHVIYTLFGKDLSLVDRFSILMTVVNVYFFY